MLKIAIVFGFSEACYELARQLIVSCYRAANLSKLNASYHFIAYECNYNMKKRQASPFLRNLNLQSDTPIDAEIIQIKGSDLNYLSALPDIAVYHHFATTYLDNYDYALFCHDDIYLKYYPVFRDIVGLIDLPNYDLIAEASTTCLRDLSVRFRPAFIFTRCDKFRRAGLTFVNQYNILHPDIKAFDITIDGGAGLLASYYQKKKPTESVPYQKFPTTWFKHLRFNTDYGVEMYNLLSPNSPQFQDLINKAKRYADYFVYGTNTNKK